MSIVLMALPLQAELAALAHATQLGISEVSTATLWPTRGRDPHCHYYLRCLARVSRLQLADICVYSVCFHAFISHTATSVAIFASSTTAS